MFLIIVMCSAGVPSAPRNISVDNITAHSANLRWDAPRTDGGSQILGYIIEKRQAFSQRFIRVNRELVHATSFTLSDLIEGNDYEVRVIAENAAGESKPSDTTGTFLAKDPYGMLNYMIYETCYLYKILIQCSLQISKTHSERTRAQCWSSSRLNSWNKLF